MITTVTTTQDYYFDKYEEPQRHLAALLGASIVTLDFRLQILYLLADAEVRTVADLLRLRRSGLRNARNIGAAVAAEVEQVLTRYDLINVDRQQKEWP